MSAGKIPPRRRDVGTQGSPASNGVVSIRAHAGYRPDFRVLTSNQVAAARQKLGLTHAEFADYLTGELGWLVYESAVKRWETSKAPPGDAYLACTSVTQGGPSMAVSLLAAIPPAFPADVLAGPWVTCYQFSHDGEPRYHADIAHVTIGTDGRVRAVNHPPEPRSEGRDRPFRNEIDGQLNGRHVGGEWMNTSDTRYYGWFQLAVLPGEIVMRGGYYGVASDIEVSNGTWTWVRLDLGPVPPAGLTLRDPRELYDLVTNHSQYGEPLTLADVRGDS
jgi:DNA-binding transcriptional regulator YiaG